MMLMEGRYSPPRCHVVEHLSRVAVRSKRVGEGRTKALRRKLQLELYELEPESGEDERLDADLDLDQLED